MVQQKIVGVWAAQREPIVLDATIHDSQDQVSQRVVRQKVALRVGVRIFWVAEAHL